MKRILISIMFCAFAIIVKAQNEEQIVNKVDSLSKIKNYTEAIALLEKDIKSFKNDTISAILLNKLGFLYSELGDYEQAKEDYLKAKMIWKEAYKEYDNLYLATSLNGLVMCYYNLGDTVEAEDYFEWAKKIEGEVLGKSIPDYDFYNFYNGYYQNNSDNPRFDVSCYDNPRDSTLAEIFFFEAANIYKKLAGEKPRWYGISLRNLGKHFSKAGNFVQAEKYLLEAKNIFEQEKGTDEIPVRYFGINTGYAYRDIQDSYYASSLIDLSKLYFYLQDYSQAEKYYLDTKKFCEELGVEDPYYNSTFQNLAFWLNHSLGLFHYYLSDYVQAEKYLLEAKDILEERQSSPKGITLFNNLGRFYEKLGYNEYAEKYYREVKTLYEAELNKELNEYLPSLDKLGTHYYDLGNIYYKIGGYEQAEKYFSEAKNIYEYNHFQVEEDAHVVSLNNIGAVYYSLGDYEKAKKYFQDAIDFWDKTLKREYPDYATSSNVFDRNGQDFTTSLNILATLYFNAGNYEQAEKYYLEVKNSWSIMDKNYPVYVISLNDLGSLYYKKGDYAQAIKYYLEVKDIIEEWKDDYSHSANGYVSLYMKWNIYAGVEKYYIETVNVNGKTLDKEYLDYISLLNNIAEVYSRMGNNTQSEKYLLETKNIKKSIEKKELPIFPDFTYPICDKTQKILEKAESLLIAKNYAETIDFMEKNIDFIKHDTTCMLPKSIFLQRAYFFLGESYFQSDNYEQALQCFLKEKNYEENYVGVAQPKKNISLINKIGEIYIKTGKYEQAEEVLLEAANDPNAYQKGALVSATDNSYYELGLNTMWNLYLLYLNAKNYKEATEFDDEACELATKLVMENFSYLPEIERNKYWKRLENLFTDSYALSYFHPEPEVNGINYNNTLFIKELLLRTKNSIRDSIISSGNEDLISQLDNLNKEIGRLQQKTDCNGLVQALQKQANDIDRKITQVAQVNRTKIKITRQEKPQHPFGPQISYQTESYLEDTQMTWQEVQKQLKPTEAAIEFVNFRLYDKQWTDSTMYAALVLRRDVGAPVWIPLFEEKELQDLLQTDSRNSTYIQIKKLYSERGEKLYQLVWQALEKELSGIKSVYYSPSGLLHKIAFDALPINKEDSLLSDKYDLHLVSSTREIANMKREAVTIPKQAITVVYGGLNYDMATLDARSNKQSSADNSRTENEQRPRGWLAAELPDAKLRGNLAKWDTLPGTRKEAEKIDSLLEKKHIPYRYFTKDKGTEESFKQLSGTKTGVIHLATHGFFLDDIENSLIKNLGERLGGSKEKPFENPLLRSGLILSGANKQWTSEKYITEDGMEDGILTSNEISQLNLTKTKLVVMSACDTGLGIVNNSEGVFGLQRAFKLAGVESLIMSLWEVPDDATAELMTTFYQQWLSGQSKQTAFKTAQQKVREKYKLPYYWAAFVMMD